MSTLTIISEGGRVEYEVWTTGEITDVSLEAHEELDDRHVRGHCNGHTDALEYGGSTMDFVCHDGFENMTLELDGDPVNIAHLKMQTATVESVDGNMTSYGIASTGHMVQPASTEGNDHRISDTEFEGEVIGGTDEFAFQGNFAGFWCNRDCYLTVNGERERVKGDPPAGARF